MLFFIVFRFEIMLFISVCQSTLSGSITASSPLRKDEDGPCTTVSSTAVEWLPLLDKLDKSAEWTWKTLVCFLLFLSFLIHYVGSCWS